jgi:hypothetical protein
MPSGLLLDECPVLASGFRPAQPLAPVKTLAWSLVPGPWPLARPGQGAGLMVGDAGQALSLNPPRGFG